MPLRPLQKYLERIPPIDEIPLDWDATGYTSDAFNRHVQSDAFSGWEGDEATEREAAVIADVLRAQPGDCLLDVACGYGRHAEVLAAGHGLRVTGLDVSPGLIAVAKRRAQERALAIAYEAGNARDLSWIGRFHHALIAFNSFSLFSPADAPEVLRRINGALRRDGRFFLDLDNKPYACRYGTSARNWHIAGDALTLQEVYFHADCSVEVNRDVTLHAQSGGIDELVLFKRLYSRREIVRLLEQCRFRVDDVYGGWDLRPFAEDAPKLILGCTKHAASG